MVTEKRKHQVNLALGKAREIKRKKNGPQERGANQENSYTNYSDSELETEPPSSDDSDSEFEEEAELEWSEATREEGWCGENEEGTRQTTSANQSGEEEEEEVEDEGNTGRGQVITNLKYHEGAGESLKNTWGVGSARTDRRKRHEAEALKAEASKCYDIRALWERGKMLGVCKNPQETIMQEVRGESFFEGQSRIPLLEEVPRGCSPPTRRPNSEEREAALADMLYLLGHKKKIKEKYGDEGLTGAFRQRHEMVLQFLRAQRRKENFGLRRRRVALGIANSHGRGMHTARMMIQWELQWIEGREISRGQQGGGDGRIVTWFEDEGVLLAAREYIMRTGEKVTARGLAKAVANFLKPQPERHTVPQSNSAFVPGMALIEDVVEVEGVVLDAIERVGIQDGVEDTHHRKRKGIRARTARRWLARLGFQWTDVRKGVYIDGHERPDVIEERVRFLEQLEGLQPYLVEFDEFGRITPKVYPRGCEVGGLHPPVILVTHDESTLNSNEARSRVWKAPESTYLRPKGRGRGIMISDFLLPCGRLTAESLTIEQRRSLQIPLHASKTFEFGSQNHASYWSTDDIISHTLDTAVKMFEAVYPGYKALFLFDNASSHSSFAEDALRVQNMNLSGGGDQPAMRNGFFLKDGIRIIQEMVDDNGVPKGIETILRERELWTMGLRLECPKIQCEECQVRRKCKICVKGSYCLPHKPQRGRKKDCRGNHFCSPRQLCDLCTARRACLQCTKKVYCEECRPFVGRKCPACEILPPSCLESGCCGRKILSLQYDFLHQKGKLQEMIEATGHTVLFYPKFHCELNWIEYYWGQVKRYTRDNCEYNYEGLKTIIPQALSSVKSTTISLFFARTQRIMEAYRLGFQYGTVEYREYLSHRRVRHLEDDF